MPQLQIYTEAHEGGVIEEVEERDMASLDSRDGRAELEGKEGHDTSVAYAPDSHVTYGVEEPESEGPLIPVFLWLQSAV